MSDDDLDTVDRLVCRLHPGGMRDWDVSSTEPAGETPVRRSTPVISPGGRDAGTVLALQNCAGNAAVGRMFTSEPEPATDVREATDDVDQLVVEQDGGFGAGLAAGLGGHTCPDWVLTLIP